MSAHVLPLDRYPGKWIAIDRVTYEVVAHADSPSLLIDEIRRRGLKNVMMMRSPLADEPLYVGLG